MTDFTAEGNLTNAMEMCEYGQTNIQILSII